jgi:signal transduction histidine kinase
MAMTRRTAKRLAWSGVAWFALMGTIGVTLNVLGGSASLEDIVLLPVMFGAFASVGAVIASRQPSNPIGWLFVLIAVGPPTAFAAEAYAYRALIADPGGLPAGQYAGWVSNWAWMTVPLILFLLLLFPTGKVPSRRWRPLGWAIGIWVGLGLFAAMAVPGEMENLPGSRNPFGVDALEGILRPFLQDVAFAGFSAGALLAASSLIFRYRRARDEERRQLRLFTYAAFFSGVILAVVEYVPAGVGNVLFALVLALITTSTAVSILKFRLYAIDLVVRKTLVYGVLAALVTGLYLLLVVAVPAAILGTSADGSSVLVILGTAVLALLLLPLRRRMAHLANRLVYGKRATPYEVLSEFAGRVGGSYGVEDVLPRMARVLAEGTGAERAEVLLRSEGGLRAAAVWPADAEASEVRDLVVPVVHQGEDLGALAVTKPRGEPLTPAEDKLVRDLAAQAGLVLRNVRLFEDLRASRVRLVEAQDAERRRLERDIHDGAQQHLVSLMVRLRLAESLIAKDPSKAAAAVAAAKEQANDALETLRDLARGIYPPLLADQGLPAALEAAARKAPLPVDVQPDGVGRYPQASEAAVYFCVLEALQNVTKYAEASRAEVRLSSQPGELRFEVVDDGRGFDPSVNPRGSGTQNMADRLEALGGSLEIRSAPGEGTTVAGRVPVSG